MLTCSVCGSRNYKRFRSIRSGVQALSLKKFCKTCNRHTTHDEAR